MGLPQLCLWWWGRIAVEPVALQTQRTRAALRQALSRLCGGIIAALLSEGDAVACVWSSCTDIAKSLPMTQPQAACGHPHFLVHREGDNISSHGTNCPHQEPRATGGSASHESAARRNRLSMTWAFLKT